MKSPRLEVVATLHAGFVGWLPPMPSARLPPRYGHDQEQGPSSASQAVFTGFRRLLWAPPSRDSLSTRRDFAFGFITPPASVARRGPSRRGSSPSSPPSGLLPTWPSPYPGKVSCAFPAAGSAVCCLPPPRHDGARPLPPFGFHLPHGGCKVSRSSPLLGLPARPSAFPLRRRSLTSYGQGS